MGNKSSQNPHQNVNSQLSSQDWRSKVTYVDKYGNSSVGEPPRQTGNKIWSILSFITSIIPIALFIYCLIISGGSLNEGSSGAIWWIMVIYYWTAGIPLAIAAIFFGIKGLDTSWRRLAIVSLSVKAIVIAAICLLFTIAAFANMGH